MAYMQNGYSMYLNEKYLYFEKTSNYMKEISRLSKTSNLIPEIDSFKSSHNS
jgi:hypothetical protein